MDEKNNFALVPRPSNAVEKARPGAKRVLAGMVAETLALAEMRSLVKLSPNVSPLLENWYQRGNASYFGRNGFPQDHAEAAKWFRMAAEQGHAVAQNQLGYCYECGKGVLRDNREAVNWYMKSADQGDETAQYNLGACYAKGLGVQQGYEEAGKWITKSAEQGDATAQFNLGFLYREGLGVPSDVRQAFKWFRLAADQGHENAAKQFAALAGPMSSSEFKTASELYREFKKSKPIHQKH